MCSPHKRRGRHRNGHAIGRFVADAEQEALSGWKWGGHGHVAASFGKLFVLLPETMLVTLIGAACQTRGNVCDARQTFFEWRKLPRMNKMGNNKVNWLLRINRIKSRAKCEVRLETNITNYTIGILQTKEVFTLKFFFRDKNVASFNFCFN